MNQFDQSLWSQLKVGVTGAGDVTLKNVGESDFTSPFWSWFIVAITVFGFIFCIIILITQLKARTNKPGEEHVQPHVWDETLQEYNNPLPRWWCGCLSSLWFSVRLICGCTQVWVAIKVIWV